MRRMLTVILSLAALLAFGSLAYAAGIADTYHNLTPSGPGTAKGALSEICVYCHTPHAGAKADTDSGPDGRAPLWNRQDPTGSYTLYSSPTYDSTNPSAIKSVSKACLSCHDGTLAFNALRNLPGSGRDGSGGDTLPIGSGAKLDTTNQSNKLSLITSDTESLTNDHPIGITYADAAGGPKSPGIGTATLGDNSFTSGFRPRTAKGSYWYINGNDAAGSAPTFPGIELPLYGTSGTVECASCHDPHEERTKTADGGGVYFLRVSNLNSQLCRTCHLK